MNPADLLDMFVADVLLADPGLARVFVERRMGCVGCTFAPFETVAEAARAYGTDPGDLAHSLASASRQAHASDAERSSMS